MSDHSRLSPSSATRWTACPGSIAAEAGRADTAGDAAALGTHVHSAVEFCLNASTDDAGHWKHDEDMDPVTQIGGWFVDRDLDVEMAAAAKVAWDYVKEVCARFPATIVYTEVRVNPEGLVARNDMSGTSDIILWNPVTRTLEVIDYKNGTHFVSAEGNLQMLIYLIGGISHVGAEEWPAVMRTTIIQPRAGGEPVRSFDYGIDTVLEYASWLSDCANLTDDPDAARIPSDEACNWCKARGDCPERTQMALNIARTVFKPIMMGDDIDAGFDTARVAGLDPDTLRLVLESKSFVMTVFKDVEAHAIQQLKEGHPVPGFKLVAGRNKRSWTLDEEAMIERFRNTSTTDKKKLTQHEYLNMSVLTAPAAEKKIKPLVSERTWNNLKELIAVSPGSPVLAPESSSKPAVCNAKDVFDVITPAADFLT